MKVSFNREGPSLKLLVESSPFVPTSPSIMMSKKKERTFSMSCSGSEYNVLSSRTSLEIFSPKNCVTPKKKVNNSKKSSPRKVKKSAPLGKKKKKEPQDILTNRKSMTS